MYNAAGNWSFVHSTAMSRITSFNNLRVNWLSAAIPRAVHTGKGSERGE
jgi:hypothetical protein